MATSDEHKRKAMDAVSHRETAAYRRSFLPRGQSPGVRTAAPAGPLIGDAKCRVMDAIANVETVAQVGWVKMAGGIAAYLGRIREVDRARGTAPQPGHLPHRTTKRDGFGRDYG